MANDLALARTILSAGQSEKEAYATETALIMALKMAGVRLLNGWATATPGPTPGRRRFRPRSSPSTSRSPLGIDVGSSTFHLLLGQPAVLPTVTINVPANQGVVASFGTGFRPFGDIDLTWFASQMNNLINSLHLDPTTLPIFLTNNVYLYEGNNPQNCCVLGFHGAAHVTGNGAGGSNGNGNQPLQTWAYAAYAQPGTWSTPSVPASPDGSDAYYIQDIHAISHEVSEWADDPFVTTQSTRG